MSSQSNWGDTGIRGTSTTVNNARAMGGMSPDLDDMILKSISIYCAGSGSVRLAVYQGGSLATGPAGASLVWDAGLITPSGTGWRTISGGSAALAKNTPTWVCWKGNDDTFNVYYDTSAPGGSDFQSAEGRFDSTAESTDETSPWSSSFPSGGAFADFWYSMYLTYEIPTYEISGITKDNDGDILGSCDCHLFKVNNDNTLDWDAFIESNAVTGAYSFTGKEKPVGGGFLVVSWLNGSPNVTGVTDHDVGEEE